MRCATSRGEIDNIRDIHVLVYCEFPVAFTTATTWVGASFVSKCKRVRQAILVPNNWVYGAGHKPFGISGRCDEHSIHGEYVHVDHDEVELRGYTAPSFLALEIVHTREGPQDQLELTGDTYHFMHPRNINAQTQYFTSVASATDTQEYRWKQGPERRNIHPAEPSTFRMDYSMRYRAPPYVKASVISSARRARRRD